MPARIVQARSSCRSDSTLRALTALTAPAVARLGVGLLLIAVSITAAAQNMIADSDLPPGESSSKSVERSHAGPSDATSSDAEGFVASTAATNDHGIDWKHLLLDSGGFLLCSHTYRILTEGTTRRSFDKPFFPNYSAAVSNLHGWADGDPFMVNYVGHPMQGAVSGFIWQHNDRAFRTVEFGRNRRYWKERLRGMAFAYVYSVQFEIGPVSEASIGHIQSFYPQVGFVDHVITPTVGTGWAIAEDAVDRIIIQRFEGHVGNPWLRMIVRTGLNPARAFANFTEARCPWCREDRPGVFTPFPNAETWGALSHQRMISKPVDPPPGVAPLEFTFHATYRDYLQNNGAGGCMGGGGTAQFRMADTWQMLLNVDGCRMLGFKSNWSGDSLVFATGPRWTPQIAGGRWAPHLQALIGGTKLTQEFNNPVLAAEVAGWKPNSDEGRADKHNYYNTDWDAVGFTVQAGGGVDFKLNAALALTLGDVQYAHSWTSDINGVSYRNAIQFTSGLVLRMGTW